MKEYIKCVSKNRMRGQKGKAIPVTNSNTASPKEV
jgi:hypothetical protein